MKDTNYSISSAPYSQNINIISNHFKSGTTCFISVTNYIIALLTIISTVLFYTMQKLSFSSLLTNFSKLFDVDKSSLAPVLNSSRLISSIVSELPLLIILILTAISFTNIYTSSKNTLKHKKLNSSFSMLRITYIFELILTFIFIGTFFALYSLLTSMLPSIYSKLPNDININSLTKTLNIIGPVSIFIFLFIVLFMISRIIFITRIKQCFTSSVIHTKSATITSIFYFIFFLISIVIVIMLIGSTLFSGLFFNTIGTILEIDLSLLTPLSIIILLISILIMLNNIMMYSLIHGWVKSINSIKTFHLNIDDNIIESSQTQPSVINANNINNIELINTEETERTIIYDSEENTHTSVQGIICPVCNADNEPGSFFCSKCGNKL